MAFYPGEGARIFVNGVDLSVRASFQFTDDFDKPDEAGFAEPWLLPLRTVEAAVEDPLDELLRAAGIRS